ncbi:MAG: hypothetical protein IT377_02680 [Polyangiaceae bacterium]|nr:hypothetical protein [Polyangiaceae bacterium]
MSSRWWLPSTLALAPALALVSMVDVVHLEGDHVSFLVLAPHPTLGFVHGGGEEGAFRRAHPGVPPPWWLRGDYWVLCEVTDG